MPCKTIVSSASETISLFEYLCRRIKEVGVLSIHGVPGDFTLSALDYISEYGLKWIGNCNELNAGYAADGYARVNGFSALMTIMGVGELSALNAIAGSFAEYVPVLHIIGMPGLKTQQSLLHSHHTLGNRSFTVFQDMSAAAYCFTAFVECPTSAPALIDKAIRTCLRQSRPVSLYIPSDLIHAPISASPLRIDLDTTSPLNEAIRENDLVNVILSELGAARHPVLLIGGYAVRHHLWEEVHALVEALAIPTLTSASGKGIIDEAHPVYAGLYVGLCSSEHTLGVIQSADLIISVGNIQTDLGSAGPSGAIDADMIIDLQLNSSYVRGKEYPGLYLKPILQTVVNRARRTPPCCRRGNVPTASMATDFNKPLQKIVPNWTWLRRFSCMRQRIVAEDICHGWFWSILGDWLREGDIILAEAGTSSFGIWATPFKVGTTFIAQYLWASIGFTVGACQGAALAILDAGKPQRRTILFVGDGSLQIGCQEISTMIRYGLKPTIFVICNSGYTIERHIHGPKKPYHDIQPWRYGTLPDVFGAQPSEYRSFKVHSQKQLERLLCQKSFNRASVLQLVEVHMAQDDAPPSLMKVAKALRDSNTSTD